jgi:hypothetical protein
MTTAEFMRIYNQELQDFLTLALPPGAPEPDAGFTKFCFYAGTMAFFAVREQSPNDTVDLDEIREAIAHPSRGQRNGWQQLPT